MTQMGADKYTPRMGGDLKLRKRLFICEVGGSYSRI